jgi:transcriptional regulator with XRE-family HTH domain
MRVTSSAGLGAMFRDERLRQRKTLDLVGEAAWIEPSRLSKLERGKITFTLQTAQRLAKALHAELSYHLTIDESKGHKYVNTQR